MTRTLVRALALGCVGVAVSACNLTASQGQINDALNGGVTTPAARPPRPPAASSRP